MHLQQLLAPAQPEGAGQIEPALWCLPQPVVAGRRDRKVDDDHGHQNLRSQAVTEPQHQDWRQREQRDGLTDQQQGQKRAAQGAEASQRQCRCQPQQDAADQPGHDLDGSDAGMMSKQRTLFDQRAADGHRRGQDVARHAGQHQYQLPDGNENDECHHGANESARCNPLKHVPTPAVE